MSEEDRIDEIIRSLSADYNRPPETPRDEMWKVIEAQRQTPGPRLHIAAGGAAKLGGYKDNNRFGSRYTWIGMAAAAVLLIATGVGIGRWSSKPSVESVGNRPTRIAENPSDTPVIPNDEIRSAPEPSMTAPAPSGTSSAPSAPSASQRSHEDIVKSPRIVGRGTVMPLPGQRAPGISSMPAGTTLDNSNQVYTLATAQHLANAEALLTSFTLGSRDQKMDAQFSQWAKGLLSNTRLLLDSPAGDDPRRAKLLQDLELVLAQIVQLSPNAAATDRELIQGSIQQGQVITRLRTAIPAGQPSLER